MYFPRLLMMACIVTAASSGGTALAVEPQSAVDRPAMMSTKASRSLLIDIAWAGKRLVAVGDRGHILLSDDEGKSWQQAAVPVSVMLTAVFFPDERHGWAVGHNGVILSSADAGASWQVQHSDKSADDEKFGHPLLDVWFADDKTGYAVGAYGYFLATQDGGATWSNHAGAVNDTEGWHLNAIAGMPGTDMVFIAGERGVLYRSPDRGITWQSLSSPFDGSFFGVSAVAPDMLLVYGLQGRLYRSSDQGKSWQQVQTGVTSGLNDAAMLDDGQIVVVGNAGVLLHADDMHLNFIARARDDRQAIMAALPLPNGAAVTVGDGGAKLLPASK